MDTKVKNLNLFSSYYRLNRLSLGQISELLRLRKESYNISKLKCPDTGQHTVCLLFIHCQVSEFGLAARNTKLKLLTTDKLPSLRKKNTSFTAGLCIWHSFLDLFITTSTTTIYKFYLHIDPQSRPIFPNACMVLPTIQTSVNFCDFRG